MDIQKTQVNSVQQFSAVNAFRSNKNVKPAVEQPPETLDGVKTSNAKTLLDRIDVNEVKKCAETVGEYNLTDDDIKYGMLYGRSVIAEWLC